MAATLGAFEHLLLLALLRRPDAHGTVVRDEIDARTGRAPSPGAIYTALSRLERRGLVSSRLGDPTPERGGKRKRHYSLRAEGERALRESQAALRRMASGLAAGLDRS